MIEEQGRKQIEAIEEHENQLENLICLLKKKKKVYRLIRKKKYSVILLQKELEKLKVYIIVLTLEFDISF